MYKPKNWQAVGNYFDTADYANLQLIDSGYEVLICLLYTSDAADE